MMYQQIAIQVGSLPISAIFISNSQVGFQRHSDFKAIIDMSPAGETLAILTNENMLVGEEEYVYNTAYDVPKGGGLREWLTAQRMISPI